MLNKMQTSGSTTGASHRMRGYRARMRAAGLRPVQIWVPDLRAPRLADEAARQSLLAAGRPSELDAMAFIDEAADLGDRE
jgi:DNA-binding LacI/PurR family transcriptional regulator